MKKTFLAVLLLSGGFAGLVHAQTPSLKPGLWETKVVKQIVDGKDMSAQIADAMAKYQSAMANMTPEQRAMVQSHMPASPGAGGGVRICISPAMAAKHIAGGDPQGHCPPASVTVSGNKMSFAINCTYEGRTTVGTGETTMAGDTMSSHVDMKTTDSRGTHTVQMDSQMHYVGADCQGVKPLDHAAK